MTTCNVFNLTISGVTPGKSIFPKVNFQELLELDFLLLARHHGNNQARIITPNIICSINCRIYLGYFSDMTWV